MLGSRGITMLVSVISLPLTINYLGAERFGMMETIVALVMMMSFADLGLGFGLQNRFAELENDTDKLKLRKAISTIFFILIFVSIILSICFAILFPLVKWHSLFNVHSNIAQNEAPLSILFFFLCFVIQIPFSIVRKIQAGFQEGYINDIWRSLGNIMGLILLVIAINMKLGVPYLILAIYGSNALFLIINYASQFLWKRRTLLPKWSLFSVDVFKDLYKDGAIFFGLQVSNIVLTSSDRIMIAHLISAEAVAIYSVGYRLSSIFSTPLDAFIQPLLPAFNDAMALNDYTWVKKVLKKAFTLVVVISTLLAITFFLGGNYILALWIGKDFSLTSTLLIGFAAFIIYTNFNSLISYIMMTPYFINNLLKIYLIAVLFSVTLKYFLIPYFHIHGALWASILGMCLFFLIPSFLKLRKQNFI